MDFNIHNIKDTRHMKMFPTENVCTQYINLNTK